MRFTCVKCGSTEVLLADETDDKSGAWCFRCGDSDVEEVTA